MIAPEPVRIIPESGVPAPAVTGARQRGLPPAIPVERISRATRVRVTRMPSARRSAWTGGAPWVPSDVAPRFDPVPSSCPAVVLPRWAGEAAGAGAGPLAWRAVTPAMPSGWGQSPDRRKDRSMKRSRFAKEQIIAVQREQEAGVSTADVAASTGSAALRPTPGRRSSAAWTYRSDGPAENSLPPRARDCFGFFGGGKTGETLRGKGSGSGDGTAVGPSSGRPLNGLVEALEFPVV